MNWQYYSLSRLEKLWDAQLFYTQGNYNPCSCMAEGLTLSTLGHWVSGLNSARDEILSEPKQQFIVQSPPCSPFHCPDMIEILLKKM